MSNKSVTVIPPGYRLTVTSWENDGDNYRTKTVEGLSEGRLRYYVDLIKRFASSSNGGLERGFIGNLFEPNEREEQIYLKAMIEVLKTHRNEFNFEDDEALETYADCIGDQILYSLGLTGGDFFTRVMESFKVEYVPHEIRIADVTGQFK